MTPSALKDESLETHASSGSAYSAESFKSVQPTSTLIHSSETFQRWLNWQCQMIAGNIQGYILTLDSIRQNLTSVAAWPDNDSHNPALVSLCHQAAQDAMPATQTFKPENEKDQRSGDLLAIPLIRDGQVHSVVGLMLTPRSQAQRSAVIQLIQWGGVWLDSLADIKGLTLDQTLLTGLLKQKTLEDMAAELVRQMLDRFDCERATVGYCEGFKISLLAATSEQASSDATQNLAAVMSEAADQQLTVSFPASSAMPEAVSYVHQQYHIASGKAVCSLPLLDGDHCVAVLTLERDSTFTSAEQNHLVSICTGVAKALKLSEKANRGLLRHCMSRLGELFRLSGSGTKKRSWAVVGALCLLALAMLPLQYRVTAEASVEAHNRQFLVAPHNGYIRTIEARVGDQVVEGQPLLYLDDRKLKLEQQKWLGEKAKLEREYQDALARGERTKLSILRARIDQVVAEADLIEESLVRATVTAPFDGVLVSGDIDYSPGAAIAIGEPLFEVAPMDRFRIVLEVSETRMAGIESGRQGELIFTAIPSVPFRFQIEQVMPAAQASSKGSHFRVVAQLTGVDADSRDSVLRPGMQGVAKVEMGERSLGWIISHRLVDRLRLWFWSLGG